ncbi:hypothetical protein BDN70DRAFT_902429 [Pholiota conissans]|uniref:Uncharacterized protein n=1 Tax=Pholiota conissans TaxID=109636 RepID=A0A9P5YHL7_9AGAR|nr:hypothetical protein BDN70DRAFT_902429 [Pholiota conissans]
MYISLCDSNFYPLVDRKTKYMTCDEKFAYRVEQGIPRTVDEWIAMGKMHTEAPIANPHKRGLSGEYPLWQDNVECILNVKRKGTTEAEGFILTLRIRVPPTTVYLLHYWQSPAVIVDQYLGGLDDKQSPNWLRTVDSECHFWQDRTVMLEMMRYFARKIVHNSRVSRRAQDWCSAMSIE